MKEIRVNLLLYFVMSLYQTPPKKRVNRSEHNRTTKKAGGDISSMRQGPKTSGISLDTYTHPYINTTYTHTYIHTYIHTYTHTYIHTYIHTWIHTHIHAYTYLYPCGWAGSKVLVVIVNALQHRALSGGHVFPFDA